MDEPKEKELTTLELEQIRRQIQAGEAVLGLELGSTRIKAVLIGRDHAPIAAGSHPWENRYEDGLWTYRPEDIWQGVRAAYAQLAAQVKERYGVPLTRLGALGVSAMMHGYLPFGRAGKQLVPFRTWRSTNTAPAARELTQLLGFHIPQRWSAAHLYQAILNGEPHVGDVAFLTTLAGYVHWQLTGEKVLGVGDASGMFPVDAATCAYDPEMAEKFNALLRARGLPYTLQDILPRPLPAGAAAGRLTPAGAAALDPTGALEPGAPLCPPEGDAGTGMTATHSVSPRTGNVSAGTSVFAMVVLERPLSRVHPEIDIVTTPTGQPTAMVHCNTCSSDLDAWVGLFRQVLDAAGSPMEPDRLYPMLYRAALEGERDCGGLVACNYYAGEPVTGLSEGRPLLCRTPDARLTLPNLMRAHLCAAIATLALGMELLLDGEGVALDRLYGHGGFFKVEGVGQRLLAGALNVPVAVLDTAGEGGPWGMALLAAYHLRGAGLTLEEYLSSEVFQGAQGSCLTPDPEDRAGFARFLARYRAGLDIERAAVAALQ